LGIELPATTKVVIGISLFIIEKWYIIILLLIVLVFLFLFSVKTKRT
jgi:type II secretory pathway component PulF